MIPFTHPAQKSDQGHGVDLHDPGEGYQEPIIFRSGSSQVVYGVNEMFQVQSPN